MAGEPSTVHQRIMLHLLMASPCGDDASLPLLHFPAVLPSLHHLIPTPVGDGPDRPIRNPQSWQVATTPRVRPGKGLNRSTQAVHVASAMWLSPALIYRALS